MTFEERIGRLTDWHGALAQAVEVIAHQQQANEERHRKNEELQEKNQVLIAQVIESIHDLARIAQGQRAADFRARGRGGALIVFILGVD